MPIRSLPKSTIQLLGACQTLTDPTSVIKELVDNALDAQASSITIEVSANTLDSIQVRDNGHGIPIEDRPFIAKPHFTSKIADVDDLRAIGGTSLGFRGTALSSIAELSGTLNVITRRKSEPVASNMKFSRERELTERTPFPQAVGTTVKITDFSKAHPVRRQQAIKHADRSRKKIKAMLQSYVLARPGVRFSLRFTKLTNEAIDWTYVPGSDASVQDAAVKIFGRGCASQCMWREECEGGFTAHAFVPRRDADASKVKGFGAFLSVDARPMAASGKIMKQIVKMHRESLQRANPAFADVNDLFLCLDITCPIASYDVNVEPAKNDVLFEDQGKALSVVRNLFSAIYTTPPHVHHFRAEENLLQSPAGFSPNLTHGKEKVLESTLVDQIPFDNERFDQCTNYMNKVKPLSRLPKQIGFAGGPSCLNQDQSTLTSNMYGYYDDDADEIFEASYSDDVVDVFDDTAKARKDVKLLNPWVISKINATIGRSRDCGHNESHAISATAPESLSTSFSLAAEVCPSIDLEKPLLPTPRASSPMLLDRIANSSRNAADLRAATDGWRSSEHVLPPSDTHIPSSPLQREQATAPHMISFPLHHSTKRQVVDSSQLHSDTTGAFGSTAPPRPRRQQKARQSNVQSGSVEDGRGKVWFDHLERNGIRPVKARSRPRDYTSEPKNQSDMSRQSAQAHSWAPLRPNRDMRDFLVAKKSQGPPQIVTNLPIRHGFKDVGCRQRGLMAPSHNESTTPQKLESTKFLPAALDRYAPANRVVGLQHLLGAKDQMQIDLDKSAEVNDLRAEVQNAGLDRTKERQHELQRWQSTRESRTNSISQSHSSRLILEWDPEQQGTYNTTALLSTSLSEISRLMNHFDHASTCLPFHSSTTAHAKGIVDAAADIEHVGDILYELLVCRVPDGEMVQDIREAIREAIACHRAGMESSAQ